MSNSIESWCHRNERNLPEKCHGCGKKIRAYNVTSDEFPAMKKIKFEMKCVDCGKILLSGIQRMK